MTDTDTSRAPVRDLRVVALVALVEFAALWYGFWHVPQAGFAWRMVLGVSAGLSFGITMIISRFHLTRRSAVHALAGYVGYSVLTAWHGLASSMNALGIVAGLAALCLAVSFWNIWRARW